MTNRIISRRELIGLATGLTLGGSVAAQTLTVTPENIMGPFYPILKPLDSDADLTMIRGRKSKAEGQVIHVVGRVVNEAGQPVSNAKIEIWQANAHGRYSHAADPYDAPLDPNFQGYAVIKSDALGRYRFKSVRPGAYPATPTWQRPPHIHLDVYGKTDRLITQMFFPNEPLNDKDELFLGLGNSRPAAVAQVAKSLREIPANETLLNWDIVLTKG
jgi:protocatechuate 3,4-dioxygenase, beta subunit